MYNFVYNWCFPASFFIFLGTLLAAGITKNTNVFFVGSGVTILWVMMCMLYLWLWPFEHLGERFVLWTRSFKKYKLTPEEIKIWGRIMDKADAGYKEWFDKTQGDDLCGPWIKDYNEEEGNLIDKIHKYFYGEHWYIAMPISASQVSFVMYYDVKDKIK